MSLPIPNRDGLIGAVRRREFVSGDTSALSCPGCFLFCSLSVTGQISGIVSIKPGFSAVFSFPASFFHYLSRLLKLISCYFPVFGDVRS